MLLLINASRNVHFLFFYVAWTKFRASFQLPHKRHRASESQNSKFNEQSKFKVKILLCKHNIYHSNIHHLVKEDIRYFFPEAVAQRSSIKKVFLEMSQNSQGNTCELFSCELCEISKNTFFTEHLWWLLLPLSWSKRKIASTFSISYK